MTPADGPTTRLAFTMGTERRVDPRLRSTWARRARVEARGVSDLPELIMTFFVVFEMLRRLLSVVRHWDLSTLDI
jgi:hypothetical protein